MTKLNKIGYSLKDVTIVQSLCSNQLHRGDVNPFIDICNRKSLPIFVSPMASVTDENNYNIWMDNKVTPVVPRSVMQRLTINERLEIAKTTFVSFSLDETIEIFTGNKEYNIITEQISDKHPIYICIDIAHGTLKSLYDICQQIKTVYGNSVIIMTGNIATPKAYTTYCKIGIDYVRLSVGTGSRCTSSANVGIHYPMATLIDDICEEKERIIAYNNLCKDDNKKIKLTKIVADGGIGWFDDINKALALGADAVMIGRGFAECEEACGEWHWAFSESHANENKWMTTDERNYWIDNLEPTTKLTNPYENPYYLKPYRNYYGMSTRTAQAETSDTCNKTSEGIAKHVEIKYPVKKWLNNVESYLRSAMTYTNSATIEDFNKAECIILGGATYQTYAK